MKLLLLFVSVIGTATSTPLPASYTPYKTNGTILGDFTDVKSFPPKVLLRFLAGCANVTIVDSDRCFVSTFAKLRVPFDLDDTFACDNCSNPPNITDSLIEASALEAQTVCAATGESASLLDMTTLSQQYMAIVSSPCWGSLRQDDAYLFVESKWIRSCAGANLPYPIPTEFINMFTIDSVQHRSTLTCMLDNLFDADPTVFGIPSAPKGSPESCFVPGYERITSNCESAIAPKAYARCSTRSGDNQAMSMAFPGNDEAIFVEEFCAILETLNTDVGRNCLMDVCDFDPIPSPSRVPSSHLSSFPTTPSPAPFPAPSPSKTPSSKVALPSTKPSPAPVFTSLPTPSTNTTILTSRPTPSGKTLSSAPSQLPSSEPTVKATKPSPVPTPISSPSKAPSSRQTASPHTPTQAPSPASSPSKTPSSDLKSPSVKPSQAPFSAPSDGTQSPASVPSEPPSTELSPPSASPSAEASRNPSANSPATWSEPPSRKPSASSTSSPTASQFPSTGAVQAYVGVEVLAMVTINVTLDDIPSGSQQSFVNILESAVESIVDGLSTATIRLPLDPTRLRRLQSDDSMDLEVKVSATRDCRQADCQAYGIRVADGIEENIRTNIADGGLVKSMRALAANKNVTILETADLYHVKFLNPTITADSVVGDNTDDETSSSAPKSMGLLSCAVAIIFSSMLFL